MSPATVWRHSFGDLPAIVELGEMLEGQQVFAGRVTVNAAFHLRHIKSIEDQLIARPQFEGSRFP